jgi:hypothetical protein
MPALVWPAPIIRSISNSRSVSRSIGSFDSFLFPNACDTSRCGSETTCFGSTETAQVWGAVESNPNAPDQILLRFGCPRICLWVWMIQWRSQSDLCCDSQAIIIAVIKTPNGPVTAQLEFGKGSSSLACACLSRLHFDIQIVRFFCDSHKTGPWRTFARSEWGVEYIEGRGHKVFGFWVKAQSWCHLFCASSVPVSILAHCNHTCRSLLDDRTIQPNPTVADGRTARYWRVCKLFRCAGCRLVCNDHRCTPDRSLDGRREYSGDVECGARHAEDRSKFDE